VVWGVLRGQRDPWALLRDDTLALLRLGSNLTVVAGYARLSSSPRLMPHAAAIAARASKLERFAPGIMLAVDGYLDLIEPHLDEILERFERIEPILPFVLEHLEVLVPHCGVLLDHFESLMLYADEDGRYLKPLIPYLPVFAPKLDALGPHLALLRPHLDRLLPHMKVIAPVAERFAPYLAVSANADILFWYLGWVLKIPKVGGWTLRLNSPNPLHASAHHDAPPLPTGWRLDAATAFCAAPGQLACEAATAPACARLHLGL